MININALLALICQEEKEERRDEDINCKTKRMKMKINVHNTNNFKLYFFLLPRLVVI